MKKFTLASVLLAAAGLSAAAQPYTIPTGDITFTEAIFNACTVENANGDTSTDSDAPGQATWTWNSEIGMIKCQASLTTDPNQSNDDWLFIPMTFAETDKNLEVTLTGFAQGDPNKIGITTSATASSEGLTISDYTQIKDGYVNWTLVPSDYKFSVSNSVVGNGYLAIHCGKEKFAGNVYLKSFSVEAVAAPEPIASAEGNFDGGYTQKMSDTESSDYYYNLAYSVVYNADKTLTITGNWTWKDAQPVGAVDTMYVIVNGAEYPTTAKDGKITTTATFEEGDQVTIIYKSAVALGAVEPKVIYTVGENTATEVPTEVEGTGTGISSIDAENGAVEYFNLAGVRVANPEKGSMVIARQGGRVVKMIIR